MADDYGKELLKSLSEFRWQVVFNTFGNDHATLIGLLVDWWVSRDPRNCAIEAGPSSGYYSRKKHEDSKKRCDALLCEDDEPVGVVEVEGSKYDHVVGGIDEFFDSKDTNLHPLKFAVLLFYTCTPRGRGSKKHFPLPYKNLEGKIAQVASSHPNKFVIVLVLQKVYKKITKGIRSRVDYYQGIPYRIDTHLYCNKEHIAGVRWEKKEKQ